VFDPERFLGSAAAAIDRFTYLPFGAGPRKCIGSTFALQEATLVLASIVKRFRFELKPGHPVWPMLRVTLRPANGMPMMIAERSTDARAPGSSDEFTRPQRRTIGRTTLVAGTGQP
jgi:cytochrome P450